MQERRHTRRMRHRIRKRVVFAMAFLGFSTLFYQSIRSFEQDQAAALHYAPPAFDAIALKTPGSAFEPPSDTSRISGRTALQGPVAIGLAFRIDGNPELHAQLARLRDRDNLEPVLLPELVSPR